MKKIVSLFLCMMIAFSLIGGMGESLAVVDMSISAEAAEEITMPYYYYTLSKSEQDCYKEIREAVLNQKSTVKLNTVLSDDLHDKLTYILMYSDDLTFNVVETETTRYSKHSEIKFTYQFNKESYDKMVAALDTKADAIIERFTEKTSTYSKIKMIHDYIIKTTDYELETNTAGYAYGALIKKEAKCDGYSRAFSYICSKAGIRVLNVVGYADESHMWNMVKYNKQWYNIDVTWDDPASVLKENLSYSYFMISDSAIEKTHKADDCPFDIPAATDNSQNYYKIYNLQASSSTEAHNILVKNIAKMADQQKTTATIQFTDKQAMDDILNYLQNNNGEQYYNILDAAQENTSAKLITYAYQSMYDEDMYTFTIIILYQDSSASKYYNEEYELDDATIKFLNKLEIKV